MKKTSLLLAMILVLALLAGCGGGGGGDTPPIVNPSGLVTNIDNGSEVHLGSHVQKQVFLTSAALNGTEGDSDSSPVSAVSYKINLGLTYASSVTLAQKHSSSSRHYDMFSISNPAQDAMDRKAREFESEALKKKMSYRPNYNIAPLSAAEGDSVTFFVENNDSDHASITATCKKVGTYCNIFVDNLAPTTILDTTFINDIATYFDNTVYSNDRSYFGLDTNTDGDIKVYILFSQLTTDSGSRTVGYFWGKDKYSKTTGTGLPTDYSNQKDMFYLTIPSYVSDLDLFKGTLAHEFQHMINFDRHVANHAPTTEKVWLNEALSEVAAYLCTNDNSTRTSVISDYLSDPRSLTCWDYNDVLPNYAASRLFGLYLYDRFYSGNHNLFYNLVNNTSVGIQNVTNVTGVSFNSIFRDWNVALFLSDTGQTTDPKYQYHSINLHQSPLSGLQLGIPLSAGSSYTANYYPYTPLVNQIDGIQTNTALMISNNSAAGTLIVFP